jgi:anti-sigma B factor antagonist
MSQITIIEKEDYKIIKLSGQFIGGEETDALRVELKKLSENTKTLIIDMENVGYLNSLTLGVLISSNSNFSRKDSKMIICNLKDNLKSIFTVTKLYLVLNIVDKLQDIEL